MAIIIKPPVSGGGGGAVDSVNGETGVVVLTTDNIAEGSNADRQYFTSTLQTDLDAKADQTALDTVQSKTLYSNSYYVNEGVNDIQTIINSIAGGSGAYAVYMSAGSYSGSTLTISDAPSGVDIIGPEHPTSGHICELVSRGLTISGASTTRIRMNNINVEGALLINGTQGRHYFKNVIFDSTVTINNACANFITFEQCSFAGGISIASNVTATVYFDRCALGNQFITSSRSGAGSPLLTILTECSGVNALQTNLTSNVVLVGRTGFNNGSVVQYQNSDTYVYDLNNGLSTSFSGSYSELRNKPTIPTSSDDLTEGSTNLFYTNTRFDNRLATKTTDNLTEGSTNQYFTAARAKTAAVVNSTAQSETDQAASVAAMKSYVAANAGAVNSVNSVSPVAGNVSLTTDNLTEGSTNLYYTNTRFDNRLATKTTDNLSEGSTNLYYTSTRVNSAFDTRLATKTTDNLTEGTTNKYFSDTLARNAFSAGTGITITSGQIATTITQYTDTLAKTAAVIDSMAGSQPDQAPSVSSVKSYVSTQVADIQATLGASGTLIYKGTYDANAASPSLALAKKGFFYQVSANGTLAGIDLLTSDQIVFISDVSGGVVQSSDFIKIDNTESPLTAGKFPVVPIVADNSTLVTNAYNLIVGGGAWNVRIPKFADVSVGDVIYLRVRSSDQIVVTRTGGTIYSTTFFFNETNSGGFNTFTIQSGQSGIYEFRCTTKNTATSNLTFEVSVANATRTTDDLREGTTNKYFSTTLARNAFSAGTGITITSGQIATTITQYTDALAKSAAVVNSMAGSQPDQAPSVSSVKSYYTAGTGISIVGGQISTTVTGASRPVYSTEASFPLNLGAVDYTGVIKRKYYINNGSSAVTINLPAVASNDGLELVFKLLGTGTATLDGNASETIDGATTFALSLQNSSITLTATSAGWRIE